MENMKGQQLKEANGYDSMKNIKEQHLREAKGYRSMENIRNQELRQVIADKYSSTIRKIRAALDEVKLTFFRYPEVDIALYDSYEKDVIDMNLLYIDQFVKAFGEYDYEGMKKIHYGIIEAVIEISEKFKSS